MLNDWLGDTTDEIDAERRAVDALRRIQRSPVSISVIRQDKTSVAAQSVRIEYDERQYEENGQISRQGTNRVTVFGVRDHPNVSDTDLRRGDEFIYENARYRIVSISLYPGEIQALSVQIS